MEKRSSNGILPSSSYRTLSYTWFELGLEFKWMPNAFASVSQMLYTCRSRVARWFCRCQSRVRDAVSHRFLEAFVRCFCQMICSCWPYIYGCFCSCQWLLVAFSMTFWTTSSSEGLRYPLHCFWISACFNSCACFL